MKSHPGHWALAEMRMICTTGTGAYRFQQVAATGDRFAEILHPTINNKQEVAFVGVQRAGDVGVFADLRGELCTIIVNSAARREIAINDAGTVFFSREFLPDETGGLFSSHNGRISAILTEGRILGLSANNRGSVAFVRSFGFDDPALFLFSGGRLIQLSSSPLGGDADINDQDDVVYISDRFFGDQLSISHKGAHPTRALDLDAHRLSDLGIVVLNNQGMIAITASEDSEPGQRSVSGAYLVDHGNIRKLADDCGVATEFFFGIAINNDGEVAFFNSDPETGKEGIYTGPDRMRDKIIATGDMLFGATVVSLNFGKNGLNDHGVIAFTARLSDGRQVLARAYPAGR